MGIIHSCTADKTVGGELEKMKQLLANMKAKSASFILLLLIIITVFIFWSFIPKAPSGIDSKVKTKLDSIYSEYDLPDIVSMDGNEKLKNYYIASSYNTCRGPSGYEDMVAISSLQHALKKGARALDFEIYSINKMPYVAASDFPSFKIKKTFNHLPITEVLKEIKRSAFSSGVLANSNDPLFLNFRMKTRDEVTYRTLLEKIEEILGDKLLYKVGPKYKSYLKEENLLDTPLNQLRGKVIIIMNTPEIPPGESGGQRADGSTSFHSDEKINMFNKHPKHWIFRFIDIQNKHGPARFKEANKREYVQVYPNLSDTIKNINWGIPFSYGCQMVFMNYGTRDDFMKSYQDHFKRKSFVLKPKDLRYIPITVKAAMPNGN